MEISTKSFKQLEVLNRLGKFLIWLLLLCTGSSISNILYGQSNASSYIKIERPNSSIEVCDFQTSHLVFEADVLYIDIGDTKKYIYDYTNNIVRLKGEKTASPTNLTVITADNNYYSFYVSFSKRPQLNYFIYSHSRLHQIIDTSIESNIEEQQAIKEDSDSNIKMTAVSHKHYQGNDSNQNSGTNLSFPTLEELEQNPALRKRSRINNPSKYNNNPKEQPQRARNIIETEGKIYDDIYEHNYDAAITLTAFEILEKLRMYSNIKARHGRHGKVTLRVTGIYHSLDHAFIKYEVENMTSIPYDIDYVEFGIVETKKPRRTALTEEKLGLIKVVNGDIRRVLPIRIQRYVAILPKLAVPEDRTLYMEIVEEGRNIYLPIPYNRVKIETIKVD